MADMASSEEQVSRRVDRAGSHTRSTGTDVSAALSVSTLWRLCCSAGPHVNLARGCRVQ